MNNVMQRTLFKPVTWLRIIPGCKNLQQHAPRHRNDRHGGDDEPGNQVISSIPIYKSLSQSVAKEHLFYSFINSFVPRLGLDPKLLAKILNMSSGRCWSSEVYNPVPGVMEGVPSANSYQGGFGSQLMVKVRLSVPQTPRPHA